MNLLNKKFLQGEVKAWLSEGMITPKLADTLSQRYNLNINEDSNNIIIKIIGYFFVALALIVLIGSNWDEIPRYLKMILLLVLTFVVHANAIWQYNKGKENNAIGLFFLGNMVFGASIILIAQIYHLGEHMPDGVFAWSIGALMLALILQNRFLMIQALILGAVWAGMEFQLYDSMQPLYALFLLASLFIAFKEYSPALMFLTIIGIFDFSFQIFYDIFKETTNPENYYYHINYDVYDMYFVYIFTFLLLAIYGIFSNFFNRYSHLVLGNCLVIGIIYLLNNSIVSYNESITIPSRITMTIFYAVLAILALLAIYKRNFGYVAFCVLYVALPWIFDETFLLDTFGAFAETGISIYVSSIVVFLVAVWLIYQSSKTDSASQLYLGICTIFALALIRYIDLLGDYIGASIMFFIFAIVMFAVAKFRSRKRIVR